MTPPIARPGGPPTLDRIGGNQVRGAAKRRFDSKYVIRANGCWEWTAGQRCGYGTFWLDGRNVYAHRVSYETHIGPIPIGLHLDHLCRNRRCVNPAHLDPVACRVNILRGNAPSVIAWRRNRCMHGHVRNEQTTRLRSDGKGRICRICAREYLRAWRLQRKALETSGETE